jgi:hypothetical protein
MWHTTLLFPETYLPKKEKPALSWMMDLSNTLPVETFVDYPKEKKPPFSSSQEEDPETFQLLLLEWYTQAHQPQADRRLFLESAHRLYSFLSIHKNTDDIFYQVVNTISFMIGGWGPRCWPRFLLETRSQEETLELLRTQPQERQRLLERAMTYCYQLTQFHVFSHLTVETFQEFCMKRRESY